MTLPFDQNSPSKSTVNQKGSTVGGPQVGGNYSHTNNYYAAQRSATIVEQLLIKLQEEVEKDVRCSEIINRLQRYHGGYRHDEIKGLKAKLIHAGRKHEINDALERKESFSKLLDTWSLYASAQEIFVHLLAKAEHFFNSEILPDISALSTIELNRRINELIVIPTVNECGASVFKVDHFVAMGMFYWLAEQCFVRWR